MFTNSQWKTSFFIGDLKLVSNLSNHTCILISTEDIKRKDVTYKSFLMRYSCYSCEFDNFLSLTIYTLWHNTPYLRNLLIKFNYYSCSFGEFKMNVIMHHSLIGILKQGCNNLLDFWLPHRHIYNFWTKNVCLGNMNAPGGKISNV